ncbi:MAG: hypothetical protein BGP04_11515 [Rhizobiales bacterium 62-17]|nr:DUF192 domain-containing protein [Hyphomicrobiales bacterium]OJY05940.1 MAG: hypothetical protein BGP04_11515 [Rhizobiales bacterium 62-17]
MVKFYGFFCRGALLAGVIGLSALATPLSTPAFAQAAAVQEEANLEPLTITTATGAHKFSVEVMRTDEQRARGLMFRRYMPADRGMLFDFKSEQPVMMWMKNTYLPLDMVFISRNGTVINVAENTEPLSERTIPSARPAFAVLELNAGAARKIGLKPGDKIANSLFR